MLNHLSPTQTQMHVGLVLDHAATARGNII
jgi:hypothetical protein